MRLVVDHDRPAAGEDEREGSDRLGDERPKQLSSTPLSPPPITGSRFFAGSVVFVALTIAPCIPSAT